MFALKWGYVALFAAGLACGAVAQQWRLGSEISRLAASHAVEQVKSTVAVADKQTTINAAHSSVQSAVTASDTAALEELQNVRNQNAELVACIRTGHCGVRIKASCGVGSSSANSVPEAASTALVDHDTSPTLDADARQNYATLREQITTTLAQLGECQNYARILQQ